MTTTLDQEQNLEWVLSKIAAKKQPSGTPAPKTKEQKQKELRSTQQSEVDLWKKWKDNNEHPKHLEPLLKSMDRLIQSRANVWKGKVEVPSAAIDFEHKKQVVQALKTYNPSKGNLGTWVMNNLRHAGRFVQANQNFARIPENMIRKIGKFNAVKADITEKLGYEPDTDTLHEHLMKHGFSKRDVIRLNKEQRKGFIATGSDDAVMGTTIGSDPNEQVVRLITPVLTPEERAVHEYTFGLNGKPKLRPGDIAKKLKMDGPKVSKLRSSIQKKMEPYLRMGG